MYKILPIGGKEYKLEYKIRAALYQDCVEKIVTLFSNVSGAFLAGEIADKEQGENKLKIIESLFNSFKGQLCSLPESALTLFYAGLMEHHGNGKNGDKTILSKDDAAELIAVYFEEHADDGTDNFADIMAICMEQMGEDGFFKRVGIEKIMSQIGNHIESEK